ncbi:MAG: YkgJ family cysteine cluster protein [Dehalococcoidales bacterium]|nr:MAG: YkgJ family cysteine cluster protein [Dehalococcoidales bacterium]
MDGQIQQPQRIFRLDLEKYGLSHLDGRNILDIEESDLDKFLNGLAMDDISLQIPGAFTPENIREILSRSECRKCGACCVPNPLNPHSPGVELFEDELKIIADNTDMDYRSLLEQTTEGKNQDAVYPLNEIIGTRMLPLPCPFYIEENKECKIYSTRPLVCTIYPIVIGENDECIEIKVNCEYGRDAAKGALKALREKNPDFILKI